MTKKLQSFAYQLKKKLFFSEENKCQLVLSLLYLEKNFNLPVSIVFLYSLL